MKLGGLTFVPLFAFAAMTGSCSNEWTGCQLDESSPNIEITVASNSYAAQTRITSGGIGICYGLIGFEEGTSNALYDNLTISENTISLNSADWKKGSACFTVYTPYTEEINYLEENGLFMIPFDMASSCQIPQISKSFIIEKKNGTQSVLTDTEKLSSTLTITLNGSASINKVNVHWISTKGFYVYDSNSDNGHWENQKGHEDKTFFIRTENDKEISFEAIPEKLTAEHSISLYTVDGKEIGISIEDLIGENEMQPGKNYNAEINLSNEDFTSTIEFSPTVSDWTLHSTSIAH